MRIYRCQIVIAVPVGKVSDSGTHVQGKVIRNHAQKCVLPVRSSVARRVWIEPKVTQTRLATLLRTATKDTFTLTSNAIALDVSPAIGDFTNRNLCKLCDLLNRKRKRALLLLRKPKERCCGATPGARARWKRRKVIHYVTQKILQTRPVAHRRRTRCRV